MDEEDGQITSFKHNQYNIINIISILSYFK